MQLTWYGHSAFRLEFGGTKVLLDPFFTGNSTWGRGWEEPAEGITCILLTHGHDDHFGDTVAIAKATGATLVAPYEVCQYAGSQGVEDLKPGGHGGTLDCGSFTVSFVPAVHSSSKAHEGAPGGFVYMGNSAGLIITPTGGKPVYAMGDTSIFGDMALIDEIYGPRWGWFRSATATPWVASWRPWRASGTSASIR